MYDFRWNKLRLVLLIGQTSDKKEIEIAEKSVEKEVMETVEVPVCARCKTNPRWEVTKRVTGEKYYWSLCNECKTQRQRDNRARRKARKTLLKDVGVTNKSSSILKKAGYETVGDTENAETTWVEIDGIGPKTVEQIQGFLVDNDLA